MCYATAGTAPTRSPNGIIKINGLIPITAHLACSYDSRCYEDERNMNFTSIEILCQTLITRIA